MTQTRDIRFLVVDDFRSMRRVVRVLLHDMGHASVDEAEDGAAALRALRAGAFDFVISDVSMPILNGFELLRAIRADAALARLPVLMLTAEAMREDVLLAARSGASGYLVKPFAQAAFEETLTHILRKAAGAHAPMTQGDVDRVLAMLGRA